MDEPAAEESQEKGGVHMGGRGHLGQTIAFHDGAAGLFLVFFLDAFRQGGRGGDAEHADPLEFLL